MKDQIIQELNKVVKDLTGEEVEIELTVPADPKNGDYSSNVAFMLSKKLGKNPMEIAEELVKKLKNSKDFAQNLEKIEVAKPAFINFYLSKKYLLSNLENSLKNPEKVGKTEKMKHKKISLEFTDPNPFKEFHIGHVYTNIVGESLGKILEANGATVWRADYFGDVGMHVAKALWGLEKKFSDDKIEISDLEKKHLQERIHYFGQAYAKGATAFEEDKDAKDEMKDINKLIFIASQRMWKNEKGIMTEVDYAQGSKIDQERLNQIYNLYTIGRKWSLEYFEEIYKRLHMKFDGYYPESIAGERGYKLVMDHISDGVFVKNDGAIIFEGKKYGLHNRVFINSLGLPTYEAKELGLAPWKYEDFKYDWSIILTGNEINEYFKVLIKALSIINPDLGPKTTHIGHGMVRLPEGKMSSRTGKIVTGEFVLDEAKRLAKEKIQEAKLGKEVNEKEADKIAEEVGVGAVKYAFLKANIGRDIPFSFEESVSFEGNAGPYLQYTYTRTQSVLAKSQGASSKLLNSSYSLEPEESLMLRQLVQFGDIVGDAGKNLSPSTICTYLYEISKNFNNFYQKFRILNAEKEEEKEFRLALTAGVGMVLRQGLGLLGIEAPQKM